MKVVVTGGCGFIGINFIQYLLSKNTELTEIVVVDSLTSNTSKQNLKILPSEINFIHSDINNIENYSKILHDTDVVFNFAAETHVDNSIFDPNSFIKSNVLGLSSLLQECLKNNINEFVHISTDEVYGSSDEKFFIESDKLNPSSPYSASKASAEMICNSFSKTYGYNIKIVRPANNYGIYQQPEKLIPFSVANLLSGENVEIYGDGLNIRHWLHVEDTCEGIYTIFKNGENGEVYNIGSNQYSSNIDLMKLLIETLSLNEERIEYVKDRPGHDFRYAINIDKLLGLGWKPKKDINNELEATVKWYVDNKEWWLTSYQEIITKRKKRFGF